MPCNVRPTHGFGEYCGALQKANTPLDTLSVTLLDGDMYVCVCVRGWLDTV